MVVRRADWLAGWLARMYVCHTGHWVLGWGVRLYDRLLLDGSKLISATLA
jgi:hypothetical protein